MTLYDVQVDVGDVLQWGEGDQNHKVLMVKSPMPMKNTDGDRYIAVAMVN